jgi:hypothetical protein
MIDRVCAAAESLGECTDATGCGCAESGSKEQGFDLKGQ